MFDTAITTISDVDRHAPGPGLSVLLATLHDEPLSGEEKVAALRAHRRMEAHHRAMSYRYIAEIYDELEADPAWPEELARQDAAAELRAALHLTRTAAAAELEYALSLRERLPRVALALAGGDLDVRRAQVIVDGVAHLPDDRATTIVDLMIDKAPDWTTGQIRAKLRKLCVEADPEDAARRYEQRVEQRRVEVEPSIDGVAHLSGVNLPPHRVEAAARNIAAIARGLKTRDETRTMDQIKADVFLDLLTGRGRFEGGAGPGRRAMVDIRVDLTTLAGLDDHAGHLGGFGPVVADIARQVVDEQRTARWQFAVTDPESGDVIHTGTTRRRPDAAQRRDVLAGHQTCVFPGCRRPAADCDIDHTVPWAVAHRTVTSEMAPLCRPDHGTRHRGWSYRRLADGRYQWTSRLGRRYFTDGKPP